MSSDHILVAVEVTHTQTGVSSNYIACGRLLAHFKSMKKDYNNGVLDVSVVVNLEDSEPLADEELQALLSYPFVTLKKANKEE